MRTIVVISLMGRMVSIRFFAIGVEVGGGDKFQYLNAGPGVPGTSVFSLQANILRNDDKGSVTGPVIGFGIPVEPVVFTLGSRLAGIGIGTGNNALSVLLSPEQKEAVAEGVRDGEAKLRKFLKDGVVKVNGWDMISAFGDRQFYNGDWVLRATAAVVGLYGNDAKEAVYPLTRNLENGDRLDGSKHSYSLTFPKGNLPPVHSFWSITMYNGQTQLLVKNPIHRYLINSAMLHDMKTNPDGSLTVWIQKDSPGKANESNWLPAPDGPFYLAMRLYWPKDGKISVLPVGHGSWSPPALKVSHSHQ